MLLGYCSSNDVKQNESDHPEWLRNLLLKMNGSNIAGKSIDDISALTYYCHGYLCEIFKKHTGMTLLQYFTQIKMKCACEMLAQTDDNITLIAEKAGYDSISYFTKVFKKYIGKTPRDFKKAVKKM